MPWFEWVAYDHRGTHKAIAVNDTGDERLDRLRLAAMATLAQEKQVMSHSETSRFTGST